MSRRLIWQRTEWNIKNPCQTLHNKMDKQKGSSKPSPTPLVERVLSKRNVQSTLLCHCTWEWFHQQSRFQKNSGLLNSFCTPYSFNITQKLFPKVFLWGADIYNWTVGKWEMEGTRKDLLAPWKEGNEVFWNCQESGQGCEAPLWSLMELRLCSIILAYPMVSGYMLWKLNFTHTTSQW